MFAVEPTSLGRIVVPEVLPPGKALFYTTRDYDGRIDDELTDLLAERFGIEATLATCAQVHGSAVLRVQTGGLKPAAPPQCDALWTSDRHVALGIKIADCLPVTLMDGDVIANIHSGWRGTVQRVTTVTLETIERETSFDPKSACAYLGPAIRGCCFEVGEEVAVQFPERFLDRTHAKPHVDVAALTTDLLRQSGFAPQRIFDSGLCTRCDGSIFHSYRQEGKGGGRNLAIVAQ